MVHKECREDKQDQVSVLLNLGAKGKSSLLPLITFDVFLTPVGTEVCWKTEEVILQSYTLHKCCQRDPRT